MKRHYLFATTIITLIGSMGCVWSNTPVKSQSAEGKKENVETVYRAAKKSFSENPDDKTAEAKYIAATKALWASQAAKAAEMKKMRESASPAQKAHWEAEKKLNAALKAWKEDVDSQEKQDAAIAAQKAAFAAQKAAMPVFILNDKIIEDMNKIDFSKMGKGSYLCSEEAVKKYGDKAANGAIILKYKSQPSPSVQRPQGGTRPHSTVPSPQERVSYLIKSSGATPQEAKKVNEIFEKYNPQIEALRRENNSLLKGKDGQYNVSQVMKNNITIEEKRASMYDELSKVLSAEKVNKLYRSEMEMARHMVQGGRQMPMGGQNNKPQPKPYR